MIVRQDDANPRPGFHVQNLLCGPRLGQRLALPKQPPRSGQAKFFELRFLSARMELDFVTAKQITAA